MQQEDNSSVKNNEPGQDDYNSGLDFLKNKDLPQAAIAFHNALHDYEEHKNERGIANASDKLGEICMEKSDFKGALKHFERVRTICEKAQDHISLTILDKKRAHAHRQLKEYETAVAVYLEVLDAYSDFNNPAGAVDIFEKLSETYLDMGDRSKAADALRTAASIHKSFKHSRHAQSFLDRAQEIEQGK